MIMKSRTRSLHHGIDQEDQCSTAGVESASVAECRWYIPDRMSH